jgi:uncharacterized cofD-like protein
LIENYKTIGGIHLDNSIVRSGLILDKYRKIQRVQLSPLDLLPQLDLREKIVDLVLRGVPDNAHSIAKEHLLALRKELLGTSVENVKVVVFGGGTGLSNIVGGDSRQENWTKKPFVGLKEVFPQTRSIVCVTDDGGSTGELLKDLPLVAVGDMRHVLLSAIESSNLQKRYNIDSFDANKVATILAELFNWRSLQPLSKGTLQFENITNRTSLLPRPLGQYLKYLLEHLFFDPRLAETLKRPHCLGNLLLASAIYREVDNDISNVHLAQNQELLHAAIFKGITALARVLGACERAVLPCTSTPAQLRVLYTNGVEIVGEHKLSESKRGFPVDSVQVDYCDRIRTYDAMWADIANADILILAPGSLYSSIIPVFKVPGLADAVRKNHKALKVLVSNLWVQGGETDLSIADPERKFHVSDMIRAYEKNIPGGTRGLFSEVLCISLNDIPASVLQSYAVEGKVPIFVDRDELFHDHYIPIECGVYSREALVERGVIQHDPDILAQAIKGLYNGRSCFLASPASVPEVNNPLPLRNEPSGSPCILPCHKFTGISEKLGKVEIYCIGDTLRIDAQAIKNTICEILWNHPVIPLHHLNYFDSIHCIDRQYWHRDQQWDNVFSFFDPEDRAIKIRGDQIGVRKKLEIALMIAVGESLLGDYAEKKVMQEVEIDTLPLGRVYHLYLKEQKQRKCFLLHEQLRSFLALARMCSTEDENHYTRLINRGEGFTPPGLLMGLMYAWYIDNRLASHIEYKMSVMKINQTDLIPEQLKMAGRRRKMISFFREVIFNQQKPAEDGGLTMEGREDENSHN